MPFEVELYRRRHCVFTVTLLDATGNQIAVAAPDVVRVKIGRAGAVPLLDLDSAAPSANNSTVTATNPSTVTVRGDDVDDNIKPGLWDVEAGLYDVSEGTMLHVERGPLALVETQLGDIEAA